MLKMFPIIFVFMYLVISMVYAVEFAITRSGGLERVIDYALFWPARVI